MKPEPRRGRDLRDYARGTQARLVLGGAALLFGVGGLLIYLFYGPAGAALGIACLVAGLVPVVLILAALGVLEIVRRRADES